MMAQSDTVAIQDEDVTDTTRTDRSGRPPCTLRVLVVGNAGQTGTLEGEPTVIVERIDTLLEAIALISSTPRDPFQINIAALSPEVWGLPALKEFTEALHFVDPNACIVHIGPCEPAARELIHGVVSHQMQPDEIRTIIETRQLGAFPPPVEVLAAEDSPEPAPSEIGDAALVQAVMLGTNIQDSAMTLIRQRLGDESIIFAPLATEAGQTQSGTRVEVQCDQRAVGHLVTENPATNAAALEPHAAWLGAWLTLDRRFRDQRIEALTDPLTGAWNRRYFDRYLARAIDQAQNTRMTVTVLVFDIDEFKRYNDRFGHAAGDEILVEIVRLLRSVIRPSDRVCRIGGDEFAVIFYEPRGPRVPASRPPESIYRIARRFQSQVQGHRFPKLGEDAPGTLTISGGLATYPWDGRDPEALLQRADQLALQSKTAGKNAITLGPGAARACCDPDDD
jgi:diguanylate cyclase (GGDEF)-like protein